MAKIEHPERYNWWLNELESLGISTLEKNGINNRREVSDLTDAVKQTLYEEYLKLIVKDSDLSDALHRLGSPTDRKSEVKETLFLLGAVLTRTDISFLYSK